VPGVESASSEEGDAGRLVSASTGGSEDNDGGRQTSALPTAASIIDKTLN
jgi:hypothetical protein